jgi:hypothetical protein
MVGAETLNNYKMNVGDYLKKNAGVEHKTSNFTPRFLALLKKSSPASNYSEAPVEGGDDKSSDGDGSDGGDGGGGGMEQAEQGGEQGGEEGEEQEVEGMNTETIEFIKDLPVIPELDGEKKVTVGSPLVYEPVQQIYRQADIDLEFRTLNAGTQRVVSGINISAKSQHTIAEAVKMIGVFEKLSAFVNKYESIIQPILKKRMGEDLKAISDAIKRGDPTFVKPRKQKTPKL